VPFRLVAGAGVEGSGAEVSPSQLARFGGAALTAAFSSSAGSCEALQATSQPPTPSGPAVGVAPLALASAGSGGEDPARGCTWPGADWVSPGER